MFCTLAKTLRQTGVLNIDKDVAAKAITRDGNDPEAEARRERGGSAAAAAAATGRLLCAKIALAWRAARKLRRRRATTTDWAAPQRWAVDYRSSAFWCLAAVIGVWVTPVTPL